MHRHKKAPNMHKSHFEWPTQHHSVLYLDSDFCLRRWFFLSILKQLICVNNCDVCILFHSFSRELRRIIIEFEIVCVCGAECVSSIKGLEWTRKCFESTYSTFYLITIAGNCNEWGWIMRQEKAHNWPSERFYLIIMDYTRTRMTKSYIHTQNLNVTFYSFVMLNFFVWSVLSDLPVKFVHWKSLTAKTDERHTAIYLYSVHFLSLILHF